MQVILCIMLILVSTASLQDNLSEPVLERQAIPDSGQDTSDNWNSNKTCEAPVKSPPPTY